ncbi:MAG: hypothetical protein RBS72_12640 [Sedimentisphaerales bacterium]|jgi:hypothetical protein|nr:hypothetical protein [Sedimentisphaerales bacterium]HNY78524.1 hypothetical protein [Sedimentisphaerales bacterium]HOC63818.1 hypothetical protein [Sedimentisphaerales bacterium]HOH64506.1 hypothetical protein [Sedimentisphaerales bacterium]HQA88708.1 hypothetical protein [Sedimentisphaerales bacterium]
MGTVIWILLVAAAEETAQRQVVPLDVMWKYISSLGLVEALTFISFGSVCLFYGWRVFRILVTICFGLLGLGLGVWANQRLIAGNVIWLSLICSIFFAVLSVPFMRWGVTFLGAISGGILTAGVWLAAGLPEEYVWAGGLVGLIAGGMISFIVFKIAVILFTSLGGSTLMVVGILAIVYRYIAGGDGERLQVFAQANQWFVPTLLLVPMAIGIFLQNKLSKTDQNWAG